MANLNLTPEWGSVYQLATSDPAQGGADGIMNVPPRQLGNRTEYLKLRADQVDEARATHPTLAARLAAIEGSRGVVASGAATLKNKFVVSGFVLTKAAEVRVLHLSASGVVGAGVSKAFTDGALFGLADDDYHVAVPQNETGAARTYYAYLRRAAGRVEVGADVPDDGLTLYRLEIPAGDVGSSLAAVALTDMRVIQSVDAWVSSFTPSVLVALPQALPDTNYAVAVALEAATNVAAVGEVVVYDKAVNGFKIRHTGSADNVRVRWTVTRLGS